MDSQKYDLELIKNGDKRNVVDRYRNWTVEAIKDDLQSKSHDLEIAIENLQHDFNIGSIVRTANAFNVKKVHIIGRRHWNRRGAMVTDRYLDVVSHPTVADFFASVKDKTIIAIDNTEGSVPISEAKLPKDTVFIFGGEGPGISEELLKTAEKTLYIEQFGSTRSVNVGVAAGIAMYKWLQDNVLGR